MRLRRSTVAGSSQPFRAEGRGAAPFQARRFPGRGRLSTKSQPSRRTCLSLSDSCERPRRVSLRSKE